jgi:hypothetical protein
MIYFFLYQLPIMDYLYINHVIFAFIRLRILNVYIFYNVYKNLEELHPNLINYLLNNI